MLWSKADALSFAATNGVDTVYHSTRERRMLTRHWSACDWNAVNEISDFDCQAPAMNISSGSRQAPPSVQAVNMTVVPHCNRSKQDGGDAILESLPKISRNLV